MTPLSVFSVTINFIQQPDKPPQLPQKQVNVLAASIEEAVSKTRVAYDGCIVRTVTMLAKIDLQ